MRPTPRCTPPGRRRNRRHRAHVRLDPRATGRTPSDQSVHTPPVWPQQPGDQQMQAHLDVQVDDLERETARAVSLGATVEDHQPQPDGVRVIRDPHGHILCLFLPGF
ncbi:VOC family protein [Kribbella sp. NPDC051587]|uniref:VOC family protein n=1 Tax=Kribbella sp. NPDC051587 TaxID=3364119 RepID=UPI0037B22347